MRIHALQTGSVELKRAFLHARSGPRRKLDLFLPGPWAAPVPIHAWLIEHGDERILVDTGDKLDPKDPPFARSHIDRELPGALQAAGFDLGDLTSAVLTHMHPDHYNGAGHVTVPITVSDAAWAEIHGFGGRMLQRMAGAPLPAADYRPVPLDGGPFGAFTASRPLTRDGRVVLVATPGHTRSHASVIAIDDDGRHVLIAGDATDSLEQLHARRSDAMAPDVDLHRRTLDAILAHAREHPTVYLPSHDPESVARLTAAELLTPSPTAAPRPASS